MTYTNVINMDPSTKWAEKSQDRIDVWIKAPKN
jgi:hypothetical protein